MRVLQKRPVPASLRKDFKQENFIVMSNVEEEDEDTMMSLINHRQRPRSHSSDNDKKANSSSSSDSDYTPPPENVIEAYEEYDKHLQAALIY